MAAPSHQSMQLLLEKITAKDKDYRYMATSDLLNELQKDAFRVDTDTEAKLCNAMINQLEDTSGDVTGLAVKCLGLLARKVADARALQLVSALCDKATATAARKKEAAAARDVASIALKTVVTEVAGRQVAAELSQAIAKKLLASMPKDNAEVVSDSLDVLVEVLDKCGGALGPTSRTALRDAMLPLLADARAPVRKRAVHCLALTSIYLDKVGLANSVTPLISQLKAGSLKPDIVRTYVQALGHISRNVGYRFGQYLPDAVPLVIAICANASDGDDEMREHCLQALEGFVAHVSGDAKAQLEAILGAARANLRYDPNVADDDGMDQDGDDGGGSEAEEEEEEDDAGDGYSDDEDVSWKVRRGAVKLLAALVAAYPDALPSLYGPAAGELVARFREREESVRCDVYAAFATLARQVGAVAPRFSPDDPANPLGKLAAHVPDVAKGVARQLRERSLKSRVAGLQLLRDLVVVVPTAVAAQLPLLAPGIATALADRSSAASGLKTEALAFTRQALAAGPGGEALDVALLKQLTTAVLPCAGDRYYKVAAEALRVCEQVVLVVRPLGEQPCPTAGLPLPDLFKVLEARISAPDQDLEVKEVAISAVAAAAARCPDLLGPQALPRLLGVLLERMRNEITRLAAVRAFSTIATSPHAVDLAGARVLEPLTAELTTYLRKALRPLRLAALLALEALCGKYGAALPAPLVGGVVEEAAGLVNDSDLSLAAQALRTLAVLIRAAPDAAPTAVVKALPQGLQLVRSPLLQGAALDQLKAFLTALAASGTPRAGVDDLLAALLATGRAVGAAARAAQLAVAQCVAVLASSAGQAKVAATAQGLLGDVGAGSGAGQRLALLCLGELGRRADLSGLPQVAAAISASLASTDEDVKGAASLALGGVACGNLVQYMPGLLTQIRSAPGPKEQYLLLTALNEVLATCSAPPLAAGGQPGVEPAPVPAMQPGDQEAALTLLLSQGDASQEECRLVIAECLGRLALLSPVPVLSKLQAQLGAESQSMRAVVVSSVKYMVTERTHPVDGPLASAAGPFLSLMSDPSPHVRRAAVVSLSAVAHQKASLVAGSRDGASPPLVALLPALYEQTKVREDLVRTVDLGPFKHRIDDGLELRKAAFEALDILLDSALCRPLLHMPTFLAALTAGLGDHVDIKAPCHLVLVKAASYAPDATVAGVEQLVPPLEATLTTRLKGDVVKQEVDRHEDLLRSCLRAVHALARLPGIEGCGPFHAFLHRTVLVPGLAEKYEAVQREWADAVVDPLDLR